MEHLGPSLAIAAFTANTTLDECDDVRIGMKSPDAGIAPEALLDTMYMALTVGDGPASTRLYKPCAEQFPAATNPVLATCEHFTKGENGTSRGDAGPMRGVVVIGIRANFYNIETLGNDARMKECLDHKGEWQAVSPTSPEYARALQLRAIRAGATPP